MLTLLKDKELILSFLISLFLFIYNKVLYLIIIYIPDSYLNILVKSQIPINIDIDLLDSDSSDDEMNYTSDYNTLDEYKNYLQMWEYDTILHLFDLKQYSFKIQNSDNIPVLYNSSKNKFIISNNGITFIDSFLFNINLHKQKINNHSEINLKSVNNIKNKIVLLFYLSGESINSNIVKKLFPNYRFLFIMYKFNNDYKYILVDLYNNYNLIKHKKIMFNRIEIN